MNLNVSETVMSRMVQDYDFGDIMFLQAGDGWNLSGYQVTIVTLAPVALAASLI